VKRWVTKQVCGTVTTYILAGAVNSAGQPVIVLRAAYLLPGFQTVFTQSGPYDATRSGVISPQQTSVEPYCAVVQVYE
jgi:hypothetical protein